jgi:hypothetical protein
VVSFCQIDTILLDFIGFLCNFSFISLENLEFYELNNLFYSKLLRK